MSIATSLFAKIAGANGTAASDFASPNSAPFDPASYRATKHIVNGLDFAPRFSKQVTVFAIFNEPATETLHETTDIHSHNLAKMKLRCNGHRFHTSHSSAFLKLQARRTNELVRKAIKLAKEKE